LVLRCATRVEPLPGKGGGNVGKTPKAGVAQRIGIGRSDYAKRETRNAKRETRNAKRETRNAKRETRNAKREKGEKREKREKREKLRKSVRRKIAAALGITLAQLDF